MSSPLEDIRAAIERAEQNTGLPKPRPIVLRHAQAEAIAVHYPVDLDGPDAVEHFRKLIGGPVVLGWRKTGSLWS